MPHACTNCDRSFPDGSTEMLSGCPSCGGNRFQFIPEGADPGDEEPPEDDIIAPDPEPGQTLAEIAEDRAQADARADIVDRSELPSQATPESPEPSEPSPSEPAAETKPADLGELRAELEDRFGSIKIVDRGEYELNLMELYERPECIIELGEDGRYAIHVPETLSDADV